MIYTIWYGLAAFATLILYFLYEQWKVMTRMREWRIEEEMKKAILKETTLYGQATYTLGLSAEGNITRDLLKQDHDRKNAGLE